MVRFLGLFQYDDDNDLVEGAVEGSTVAEVTAKLEQLDGQLVNMNIVEIIRDFTHVNA